MSAAFPVLSPAGVILLVAMAQDQLEKLVNLPNFPEVNLQCIDKSVKK
jgi:hypothetical protein